MKHYVIEFNVTDEEAVANAVKGLITSQGINSLSVKVHDDEPQEIVKNGIPKNKISTRRERVLKLYDQDYAYVDIAKKLKVKVGTIYNDVTALRKQGKIS